jgi:SPP1 gp7 family putative phage head morphogenesis protein
LDEDDIDEVLAAVNPKKLTKTTSKVIKSTVAKFGQKTASEASINITFDVGTPKVAKFLKEFAGERMEDMVNATTISKLRDTMSAGVAAGESTKDIAARVREVFEDSTDSRAETIARTEIARASNFGSIEGMAQAGIEKKEWLATQDENTRDTHSEMDGQIVGIDDDFESPAGGTAAYPGDFGDPAEDVNCRCTVLSVIDKSARTTRWRGIEAERAPFDRAMRRALRQGFTDQQADVLSALEEVSGESV